MRALPHPTRADFTQYGRGLEQRKARTASRARANRNRRRAAVEALDVVQNEGKNEALAFAAARRAKAKENK